MQATIRILYIPITHLPAHTQVHKKTQKHTILDTHKIKRTENIYQPSAVRMYHEPDIITHSLV